MFTMMGRFFRQLTAPADICGSPAQLNWGGQTRQQPRLIQSVFWPLYGLLVFSGWLFGVLVVAGVAGSVEAAGDVDSPNVVFILVDDLGWADIGCNAENAYSTPHIDELAARSLVFSSAYSCGPNCAPSRASLYSGMYTPRHRVLTVGTSKRGKSRDRKLIPIPNTTHLNNDVVTLAEVFQQAGYRTGFFGKWHLGDADSPTGPSSQGFQLNIGGNHTGAPQGGYFAPFKNPQIPARSRKGYLTDRLTDEAIEFMRPDGDQPFFAMVSYYTVHTPIQAKPELIGKHRTRLEKLGETEVNATYSAMLQSLDDNVNRVVQSLAASGVLENTLLVFYSDNGGMGRVTSNHPLRGAKGMLYEGGIRVPLFVHWPSSIKQGKTIDVPVTGVDWMPTFCELLGAEPPGDQPVDGLSLLPLIRQQAKPWTALSERSLFWHFPAYLQGRNYAGARDSVFRTRPCGAIRRGPWKLIEYFEDREVELFHLRDDLRENENVVERRPEVAEDLLSQLNAWRDEVGAQIPRTLNPDYEPNLDAPNR